VKARGLDKAKAGEFADARVFIAAKAQRLGLIDAVGSIEDAKAELLKLSNVQNPVWKEPDFIDKIGKKLAVQMSGEIASMLFGTKVYW
jgi:protease-4